MNHYDVIVMALRPATAAGAGPLKEVPRVATIQCHHHRDRSGRPVFGGAVCGRGHDSRESAADAPETDGVFHLVGARIQQICLSI
jgi:hypothetical protein